MLNLLQVDSDVVVKPMEALWTAVTSVITNLSTALGTVGSTLMNNTIFQLMLGIMVFYISIGIIFKLVRHARKGK